MNPTGGPGTRVHPNMGLQGVGMGRASLPGGGNPGMGRRPGSTGGKLMRLRCRFRPLHDAYLKNGDIAEDDTDVIFICGDGHQLRAHRVIMASSSKFFAKLFEDQSGEVSVVNIPDIKVDIMKLILQLTYRDRVILTMRQIKEVGEFITMFGMAWAHFGFEEYNGDEPMSALPMPPVPQQPVELPQKIIYRTQSSPPTQQGIRRVTARGPMQLASNNGNDNEEQEHNLQGQEFGQQGQVERTSGHSRKSRLTPRAGTEAADDIVEQDGEEDPENLIRDWMSKLGKRDPSTQNAANAPMKRIRLDESGQGQDTADSIPGVRKNVCTVCNTQFQTESAWRWHEDRHVGINMFKCQFCDTLSRSPKLCYIHEKEVHDYSGLQGVSPTKATPTDQKRVLIRSTNANQPGKMVVLNQRSVVPSEAQKITKRIKMAHFKKMQAQKKKAAATMNFAHRHPQIGIGESEGSELLDVKKIKQLHWLYVCERCDNCSDSASKATMHYNRCYPAKEMEFEDTVTKFRQGFYGKSKCPLCPRRYPQNSGFMIHCGHQHQQYRKLFSHTGSVEDNLKCSGCKEKFSEPLSFHEHLRVTATGTYYCGPAPTADDAPAPAPKPGPGRPPGSKAERQTRPRRAESPIESKASYKVQFHTPPRSARLASRAQAEATAEANAKTKATDINFPPVDCPVCGDSDLPNISLHLQTKHKDLNVDVTRISSELLRCKGCTITFDICDLLDHKDCMLAVDNEKEDPDAEPPSGLAPRRSSTGSTKQASSSAKQPTITTVDMSTLPPGVGRSPIERIEINDLHSISAIRQALTCLVCKTTAKKLGVIADCLRAHGIFRCSLCFNSYCNKADYALHLKKCHGSGSNKLKCPLCPKAFANAGQTSGHMYSTHWLQMLKENEAAINAEANGAKNTSNSSPASNNPNDQEGDSMDQQANTSFGEESGTGNDNQTENQEVTVASVKKEIMSGNGSAGEPASMETEDGGDGAEAEQAEDDADANASTDTSKDPVDEHESQDGNSTSDI